MPTSFSLDRSYVRPKARTLPERTVVTTFNKGALRTKVCEFYYNKHGLLHRNPAEGPAAIEYCSDGKICVAEYRWYGLLHRKDGPAYITYSAGEPLTQRWHRFGLLHRRDGPSVIANNFDNTPHCIAWHLHGYNYRDPRIGPATEYYHDGKLTDARFMDRSPTRPTVTLSWLRRQYGPHPSKWDRFTWE